MMLKPILHILIKTSNNTKTNYFFQSIASRMKFSSSGKFSSTKTKIAAPSTSTSTPHLLPCRKGNIGIILLNKPSSLNALTLPMIHSINTILPQWQKDDSIKATVFQGSPKEGKSTKKPVFCAGGDVKSIYMSGLKEKDNNKHNLGLGLRDMDTADFFRHEYQTNYYIAMQNNNNMKPQISIWDGLVMGGGLGLSIHGKYRIATQNTLLAMPETAIGFFPDVGSMYWLPRLPNSIGVYMALTGYRCNLHDCLYLKLATHHIPSEKIDAMLHKLKLLCDDNDDTAINNNIEDLLKSFHKQPTNLVEEASFLYKHALEINHAFSFDKSLEEIISTLSSMQTEFATNTLATLSKVSPTSCKVTLQAMKHSMNLSNNIAQVLQMEYRMSQRFMKLDSDFYQGIRAVLVDKDHNPQWNPKRVEDVSDDLVGEYFEMLEDGCELELVDSFGDVVGPSKL